jgi:hypothetical protein
MGSLHVLGRGQVAQLTRLKQPTKAGYRFALRKQACNYPQPRRWDVVRCEHVAGL